MYLRGTTIKTIKNTQIKFPHFNSLRKTAQIPKIPPEQKTPTRDPISGVFTPTPLL
jgi:hypothetical protein